MHEFKPEFLKPFLYMENSCLCIVNIEHQGNRVKYYIGNTFVGHRHCRFRYTKIVYRYIIKRKSLIMYEKQDI